MAVFGQSLIEFGDGTTFMQVGVGTEGQIALGLHTLTSEQKNQVDRGVHPGIDIGTSDCMMIFKDFASFKKVASHINKIMEDLRENAEEYGIMIEEEK